MPPEIVDGVTQFGVAGLMGVLWVWERLHSRKRETQLTEAHDRLIQERASLQLLMSLVQQNTAAIERFDRTQSQLIELLEKVQHENRTKAA